MSRKRNINSGRQNEKVILQVTGRELATILAALRGYQDENAPASPGGASNDPYLHEVATNGGTLKALTRSQIGALCERLNAGPLPAMAIEPPPDDSRPGEPMYRVVYQTDLHATSTRRAAREAWQTIKESDGPILHVIDHDGNVVDEDLEVLGEGEREEQE